MGFVRSLHQKKYRAQHQLFIVEGEKMVEELLASDFRIQSIYASEKWAEATLTTKSRNILTRVSEKVLEQLSALKTANQVIAVVHQPNFNFKNKLENKYYLALDAISDPGNMGTILRIADWFGIDEIFYSRECVEIFNPKVVQATMGSVFRVKAYAAELLQLFEMNKNNYKLPVLGTILKGKNIYEQHLPAAGILMIGNESRGINPELQNYFTLPISIPSFNSGLQSAESLNAAVATGIVCSELKRKSAAVIKT